MGISRILAVSILMAAAACSAAPEPTPPPTSENSRSNTGPPPQPTQSETPTPSTGPSVVPSGVPDGTPEGYAKDVAASKIPPSALVQSGLAISSAWSTKTSVGDVIGVAYIQPGDPLRAPRGLVIWRRTRGSTPPWSPVFGLVTKAGVLELDTQLGDATGDGSDDALVFEGTGGSGACGTTVLIDLAANSQVFKKKACDSVVAFSPAPIGLSIRAAVFAQDDAHCCPSSFRTTVLTYDGASWRVDSKVTTPT